MCSKIQKIFFVEWKIKLSNLKLLIMCIYYLGNLECALDNVYLPGIYYLGNLDRPLHTYTLHTYTCMCVVCTCVKVYPNSPNSRYQVDTHYQEHIPNSPNSRYTLSIILGCLI